MTTPHDPYRSGYGNEDPHGSGNVYGQSYGTPQSGPPAGKTYGTPTSGSGYQQQPQPGWGPGPQQPYGQPVYDQPQQPYQQPAYGAGPAGYGAPPPKKKSNAGKIVGIIAAVVVGLCVLGSVVNALGGGTDTTTTADTAAADSAAGQQPAESDAAKEKKVAGLNTPVRDGEFEFTVTSVKCGETQVGTEYLNETAQGQFCLVAVTVKNIGDKAQSLASSAQLAYNAQGQEFKPDDAASLYVNEDQQVLYNEINPGNSIEATLVWDIPKGQQLTKLELHDSLFSGGVEVSVG